MIYMFTVKRQIDICIYIFLSTEKFFENFGILFSKFPVSYFLSFIRQITLFFMPYKLSLTLHIAYYELL